MTMCEYRLRWEAPSPLLCAMLEDKYGRDIWLRYNWDRLEFKEWGAITDQPWQLYAALMEWQCRRTQPVRNVLIEQRQVPLPDEGWEPVLYV